MRAIVLVLLAPLAIAPLGLAQEGTTQPCRIAEASYAHGGVTLTWSPTAWDANNTPTYHVARAEDGGAFTHDYALVPYSTHPKLFDANVSAGHTYSYIASVAATRLPPEACQRTTVTIPTQVPVFPTGWSLALAGAGGVAAAALAARLRRRA
jgi:hypothetical protein